MKASAASSSAPFRCAQCGEPLFTETRRCPHCGALDSAMPTAGGPRIAPDRPAPERPAAASSHSDGPADFGAGILPPGGHERSRGDDMVPDSYAYEGVLLNNTMDDFTAKPGVPNLFGLVQGEANAIAPGKRPLSSMSPTIVLKDGQPVMVLGSPGGSRIITAVAQAIMNVVDHGMTIQEAVDAPRLHHQWMPDVLYAEPRALSADTRRLLTERGHTVVVQNPWGAVEAILVGGGEPKAGEAPSFGDDVLRGTGTRDGWTYGANDNRRPAGAAVRE